MTLSMTWMLVLDGPVRVFQKLLLSWEFPPRPEFTEIGAK